jgi:hypothetical protein
MLPTLQHWNQQTSLRCELPQVHVTSETAFSAVSRPAVCGWEDLLCCRNSLLFTLDDEEGDWAVCVLVKQVNLVALSLLQVASNLDQFPLALLFLNPLKPSGYFLCRKV